MRVGRSKTLAVAVAAGAALGAVSPAQAAPGTSATPAVGAVPMADGCWCEFDLSDLPFNDRAFSDWSFGDWLFSRSALAGRMPFGLRFHHLPRGFVFGGVPRRARPVPAPGTFRACPAGRHLRAPDRRPGAGRRARVAHTAAPGSGWTGRHLRRAGQGRGAGPRGQGRAHTARPAPPSGRTGRHLRCARAGAGRSVLRRRQGRAYGAPGGQGQFGLPAAVRVVATAPPVVRASSVLPAAARVVATARPGGAGQFGAPGGGNGRDYGARWCGSVRCSGWRSTVAATVPPAVPASSVLRAVPANTALRARAVRANRCPGYGSAPGQSGAPGSPGCRVSPGAGGPVRCARPGSVTGHRWLPVRQPELLGVRVLGVRQQRQPGRYGRERGHVRGGGWCRGADR